MGRGGEEWEGEGRGGHRGREGEVLTAQNTHHTDTRPCRLSGHATAPGGDGPGRSAGSGHTAHRRRRPCNIHAPAVAARQAGSWGEPNRGGMTGTGDAVRQYSSLIVVAMC